MAEGARELWAFSFVGELIPILRVSPYDQSSSKRPYLLTPSHLRDKDFKIRIVGGGHKHSDHSTIYLSTLPLGTIAIYRDTSPGLSVEVTAYVDNSIWF